MALRRLFRTDPGKAPAASLYARAVAQARLPAFYRAAGVPDTLDGRFELVALHVFLLMHRLKREGEAGGILAQAVFDAMFADMDASLREMGAGDLGVPHRVKRMASGFMGRVAAYDAGVAGAEGDLTGALRRNLYGTVSVDDEAVMALAGYVGECVAALSGQPGTALMAGEAHFPSPRF